MTSSQLRTYSRADSVVFLKTKEEFGGLSNMAGGFPLYVSGVRIRTSEALYQACRFPHLPDVQKLIIEQRSPMTAKMKSKPHRSDSRRDWDRVRVQIMRWCLRVKLAQNWNTFSSLLLATGEQPIVEESRRDAFWGAKPVDEHTLTGMNVLGRLLMELREAVKAHDRGSLVRVDPLSIPDFRFLGHPIEAVGAHEVTEIALEAEPPLPVQGSLFDSSPEKEMSSLAQPRSASQRARCGDLEPYLAMRDSGVPWLGEVPDHWDVRRNGRLFAQRNETGFADLPILEVSLKTGVRVREFKSSDRKQVMSDRDKYKRAAAGDVAYNMMRMWQGAVGVAPTDGLISPAYVVARPLPGTESRYFARLFRTAAYKAEVDKYSRGIVKDRNRLYWEDFKRMPSCYPPPNEQAAIVWFLEIMERRIRRAIRAKQKLVELLEEQKQAVVAGAVTRGLDPDARVQPSGVRWLGEVPKHWSAIRLKYVAGVQTGITLGKNYGSQPLVERHYLRVANVQAGRLDLSRVTKVRVPPAEARGSTLSPGDVLMTEGGDIDKLGRGCVWRGELAECLHQNHIFAVRPNRGVLLPEFLATLLGSPHGRNYFQVTAKQTTNLAATNKSTLGKFPLLLPPVDEQATILEQIAEERAPMDDAIEHAQREIELLREYRPRLIADVVTGKLDVREAVASLPEEPGGSEQLDEPDDDVNDSAAECRAIPEEAEA